MGKSVQRFWRMGPGVLKAKCTEHFGGHRPEPKLRSVPAALSTQPFANHVLVEKVCPHLAHSSAGTRKRMRELLICIMKNAGTFDRHCVSSAHRRLFVPHPQTAAAWYSIRARDVSTLDTAP